MEAVFAAAAAAAAAAHTLLTTIPDFHHAILPSVSFARPFYSSPATQPVTLSPSLKLAPTASHNLMAVAAETKKGVAVLKGKSQVEGVVTLLQRPDGSTTVKVRVSGLTPGLHGFHLHEYGDTTNGCISTGPHFNPNKMSHGAPEDKVRHAGDLGNIVADKEGVAEATIVDGQIPLSGANTVIGRAFVVHELEDDLGRGGQELSLTTGNAGGRLACGVVGLSPVE